MRRATMEEEDGGVDVENMDPRRQAENQINVRNHRDGGIRDRRLMRPTRPGYKTKASGVARSRASAGV